jgi:hypothetical protein
MCGPRCPRSDILQVSYKKHVRASLVRVIFDRAPPNAIHFLGDNAIPSLLEMDVSSTSLACRIDSIAPTSCCYMTLSIACTSTYYRGQAVPVVDQARDTY